MQKNPIILMVTAMLSLAVGWMVTVVIATAVFQKERFVLYADQPMPHVIDSFYTSSGCSHYQRELAFRHPAITFHCDREEHG